MRTIRQQLTRKLLLGIALLLGCGGAGVYFSTRSALLSQFDETLRAKASAISSATEQHGNRISVEVTEQFMREFDEGVAVDFFQLRHIDGTRNSREGETTETTELTIVVASDRRELNETLVVLALVLLGCGALLLVATGIIVPRVLRHELAPLDQLAEQATRIHADSLSTRFATDSVPGELRPISDRLNSLLSRLEQSFERERQFSADLAHEMRTPIAELRSLADVALKWPESRPVETDRDTLAIAVQMEGIVLKLLELLRSERGQLLVAREVIPLALLAESAWQPFAGKAAEKQLNIVRLVSDESQIESDRVMLRSILTNLVDNAVEYTPRGGTIRMDAEVAAGGFAVRVANNIEHLEPADLPKFFDRFWRKDPARSDSKHSGLGLPLARAFAEALGCNLTAALDGEKRLVLTLSGPRVLSGVKPAPDQS